MSNLDDDIRRALRSDHIDGNTDQDPLRSAIAETFRRRARFLTVLTWMKMIFFVAAAAAAAYVFIGAETVRTQIASAALFVVCSLGTGVLFILYWMQVVHAMTARELKRLELTIAKACERA